MDANATAINDWVAAGAKGRLTLNGGFADGSVLLRGESAPLPALGTRVVLNGNGSGQFNVLTAYPIR